MILGENTHLFDGKLIIYLGETATGKVAFCNCRCEKTKLRQCFKPLKKKGKEEGKKESSRPTHFKRK